MNCTAQCTEIWKHRFDPILTSWSDPKKQNTKKKQKQKTPNTKRLPEETKITSPQTAVGTSWRRRNSCSEDLVIFRVVTCLVLLWLCSCFFSSRLLVLVCFCCCACRCCAFFLVFRWPLNQSSISDPRRKRIHSTQLRWDSENREGPKFHFNSREHQSQKLSN